MCDVQACYVHKHLYGDEDLEDPQVCYLTSTCDDVGILWQLLEQSLKHHWNIAGQLVEASWEHHCL